MGDVMKSNEFTIAENKRKRKSGEEVFEVPLDNVVEVSSEEFDKKCKRVLMEEGKNHLRRLQR